MQFNVFQLAFLLLFFLIFLLSKPNVNTRWIFITIASFLYYGFVSSWLSCLILFIVGISSYFFGIWIENNQQKSKSTLIIGILFLISLLLIVRYQLFLVSTFANIFGINFTSVQLDYWRGKISFLSTLGVSFYTIQAIGYLFDIYYQRISATKPIFLHFAFLSFFPKLLAGPIEKNKSMLYQLNIIKENNEPERWHAFQNIVIGLFLKNVIANNLSPLIDEAFQGITLNQSTIYWWIVITAFAIQIYCDFNGYTHIVIGIAQLMGFKLTQNFNFPYLSKSPSDFWARWHISLSTWLREYIFFPLSRSKYLRGKYVINTWITMLISGFWHGVGWTFIVWGGLHALYISIEHKTQWSKLFNKLPGGYLICLLLMWLQLEISWVLFRAISIQQATNILKLMFSFNFANPGSMGDLFTGIGIICAAIFLDIYLYFSRKRKEFLQPIPIRVLEVVVYSILFVVAVFLRGPGTQFIYFQF